MPGLEEWKEKIAALVPGAPVEAFEHNLLRVTGEDQRYRSFAIRSNTDGTVDYHRPLTWERFRIEDRWAPKFDHWWAFPVCAYDHNLGGNERAVFEHVRDDPSIKKIILTRSRRRPRGSERRGRPPDQSRGPALSGQGPTDLRQARSECERALADLSDHAQLHQLVAWDPVEEVRLGFSRDHPGPRRIVPPKQFSLSGGDHIEQDRHLGDGHCLLAVVLSRHVEHRIAAERLRPMSE